MGVIEILILLAILAAGAAFAVVMVRYANKGVGSRPGSRPGPPPTA